MKTFLPLVLILLAVAFLPLRNFAQNDNQLIGLTVDKYINVDNHKIHYQTGGAGTTTVVFESGHRDNMAAWNNIHHEVAKFAKVIRYDREGYGLSEPNTQPLSLKQIATRLHELLQKTNSHPPYILVGHSLGGTLIRAFAFLYPDETSGLVMIDPLSEYILDTMRTEQLRGIAAYDSIMKNAGATDLAEWEIMKHEFVDGFPEINSFGALPDVPMVLFATGKNRPPNWEKSVRDLFIHKMNNLSEVRFIEVPQSPHYIQNYEPSLIIENIRRVVFPDAGNILQKTLLAKGVDSCIAEYRKLKTTYPKEYMLERFLNSLGYQELNSGHTQEAIKLFVLNVEMYPNSDNVYDSLGEAYMKADNKKEAIKNYKMALSLNPANMNSVKMLKTLTK